MIPLVIIASIALMLTFGLMRSTARGARRARSDGIRWRGIDWSAGRAAPGEPDAEPEPEREPEAKPEPKDPPT